MKKPYLISLVIIIVLTIILSGMYIYANSKTKENYINYFDRCKERIPQIEKELREIPVDKLDGFPGYLLAQKCIDDGGCFITCGSGCGLPKPKVNFFEMFEFYMGGYRVCPAVCRSGCLYPVE